MNAEPLVTARMKMKKTRGQEEERARTRIKSGGVVRGYDTAVAIENTGDGKKKKKKK